MVHSGRRAAVTPMAYEQMVASHFRQLGYSVELTRRTNDYGVDAFAHKEDQKLALQAKMYGGARKLNREMVMQLHGAKDFFDCTEAVIVTNGRVAEDARQVAEKLRIRILSLPIEGLPPSTLIPKNAAPKTVNARGSVPTFDEVWERYVVPLTGRRLDGPSGRTNVLLTVDWTGVNRLTSNGRPQFIKIEIFRGLSFRKLRNGPLTSACLRALGPCHSSENTLLTASF
jgi:hypothetical protein